MKHNFICVMCPNGCNLTIDDKTKKVSGNTCPKGIEFALQELIAPKRGVSSLVKTKFKDIPVVSVRTKGDIDKKLIFPLMEDLSKIVINKRLKIGSVIIKNYKDSGVDIITTKGMEEN